MQNKKMGGKKMIHIAKTETITTLENSAITSYNLGNQVCLRRFQKGGGGTLMS